MASRAPLHNWLLRQVEPEIREAFAGRIRAVALSKGQTLLHQGDEVTNVYFPEGALIGLVSSMPAGDTVQTAMIGWDGALGVFEACGSRISAFHAEVQVEGPALCMSADDYRQLFAASESLRVSVHKYIELLLHEARQHVACSALHNVRARLARAVLEAIERSRDGRALPVTQEALAQMLGVQRTTVTAAISELQARGALRSTRGTIQVLDEAALEADACCCREAVQIARKDIVASEDEVCDT